MPESVRCKTAIYSTKMYALEFEVQKLSYAVHLRVYCTKTVISGV